MQKNLKSLFWITDEQVKNVVEKLNNRPRKRHQFNSPNEVYLQKLKIIKNLHLLIECTIDLSLGFKLI
jgi:hypothetical protein